MIVMKLTIELDIGLSFLLQAALPQLVTDRETKLIVVGGPSDRTAIADAAPRAAAQRERQRRDWSEGSRPLGRPSASSAGRGVSAPTTAEIRGARSMADHTPGAARARVSGYDGGVDGAFRSVLGPGRLIAVFTSWTSWTTTHNVSRGRRQTLLVDVDYGRKATSHKRLKG